MNANIRNSIFNLAEGATLGHGLALPDFGPELVDQIGWNAESLFKPSGWWDDAGTIGWVGDGSKITSSPTSSMPLKKIGLLIPGKRYRVITDIICISGWLEIWDGTGVHDTNFTVSGHYEFDLLPDNADGSLWVDSSTFSGSVLSLSVKEILAEYSLGSENLLENGDFSNDSAWVLGAGMSIIHPANYLLNNGNGTYSVNHSCAGKMVVGKTYSISCDILNYVSGQSKIYMGSSYGMIQISAQGTISRLFVFKGNDADVYVDNQDLCDFTVTNITIKEVLEDMSVPPGPSLGLELIDQSRWNNEGTSFWNVDYEGFSAWSYDGTKLHCNGTVGLIGTTGIYTPGKTYRIKTTINLTSGWLWFFFQGNSECMLMKEPGEFTFTRTIVAGEMSWFNLNSTNTTESIPFEGDVLSLSCKEVLMP